MRFIQHPSNNWVLGAPYGWKQDELAVAALPVTKSERGGISMVQSYWKPTQEELKALVKGAYIQLTIIGTSMPPASLEVVE